MALVLAPLLFILSSLFGVPVFMVLWVLVSDIGGFAQKEDAPSSVGMGCQAVPIMWLGQVFGWSITSATSWSAVGGLVGGALAVLLFFGYTAFSVCKEQE